VFQFAEREWLFVTDISQAVSPLAMDLWHSVVVLVTSWSCWSLVIAIAIPLLGASIVQFFTPPPDDWYKSLNKPTWTPPGWAFPVVWTSLYVLMGIASWLVYRQGGFKHQWLPLVVYVISLVFNFAWTPIFFGAHRIDAALIEIIALWVIVLATIALFWRAYVWAGVLLIPYIIWISIATHLTAYIFYNNSEGGGARTEQTRPLVS